ncbi:MAG TPA: MlaD family protein [Candidatus Angelobacter sp.]|jgi:phospholipid/cholesterol/gamma-HCH transport system substrate-binding protein|nr:MlaD family protein [Candidatus Angelobacter sp.]
MSRTGRITAVLLSSRTLMLLALGAAAAAGVAFLGGGSGHQVVAQFTDADGLVAGNEIRVAGLQTGGTVDSVAVQVLDGKQVAVAVLNIDDSHWPLHQGTTMAVRPKGVLSNVYVAMAPGSSSAPVLDASHVFTTKETSSPIQLDAFSNLFTQDVRESIRTQIQEGVVAFGGAGADNTNGLLQNLNPLTASLSPFTAVLAQRSPELDRLNGEFDTITAELAREDGNLRGLIENGNTFLHAIAVNATSLQGTLVHASGTLGSLDAALKGEESNLAAIFRKGPSQLDASANLADNTNPVVSFINPRVKDLDALLNYFLSATGYQTPVNPQQQSGPVVLNSRIDASLYFGNKVNAVACGGQQWSTTGGGPNNSCAAAKQLTAPDAGASTGSSAAPSVGSSSGASSSAAGAQAAHQQSLLQFWGGLFQ